MLGWKCIATTPLIFWFPTKVEECTKALSRLLLYPGFSGKSGSRIRKFLHRGDLPLFLISYKSWFMHQSSISTPSRWSGLVPPGSGSRIQNFFGLKPSRDQDGANKKKFSQIGPVVLEEIGRNHTHKQTSCCYIREIGGKEGCIVDGISEGVWSSRIQQCAGVFALSFVPASNSGNNHTHSYTWIY